MFRKQDNESSENTIVLLKCVESMEDCDILTKIEKWCGGTTNIHKDGNDIVRAYATGYEKGIADAKVRILEIINCENE